MNNFSGVFPPAIYNLSSLEYLSMYGNGFWGNLRPDIGYLLPNLQDLTVGHNYLTGAIPTTLTNISSLQNLVIEYNNLKGSIPSSFGKVRNLQLLTFLDNSLGSHSVGDLEFLDSLTNCTQLHELDVGYNRLGGFLPASIANMSTNLIYLNLEENLISGNIPHDIGNLINLQILGLGSNMLTGPLPTSLGKLSRFGVLDVALNRMSGEIPSSLGNITLLEKLNLLHNSFHGTVPPSFGKCSHLLHLYIGSNKLNGTIPQEIMEIQSLLFLNMSNNSLTGSLPKDVGRLQNLVGLDVSHNRLSGHLPHSLGKCLSMKQLYLKGNFFDGAIPDISGLVGVTKVDFSNNNLSGSIHEYLANFTSLQYLNLSFNNFEGRVPTKGIFQNSSIILVFGNKNLCGGIKELKLKPCLAQEPLMEKHNSSHLKKVVVGVSVGMTFLLLLFIASVSLIWFKKRKKNKQTNDPTPSSLEVFHDKISYGDLRNAKNGFSSSNMIGSGSFGTVFKALLPKERTMVAVKVLNLQRRGAMKSFMAECESLKDIRHRNLVKLLTACASIDFQGNEFRALVYEFMSNGSLDKWLHREKVEEIRRPSRPLTLLERLNIAIDVATALVYLHVHCHEPIDIAILSQATYF
ncbi:PREDICTED: probable LRR receptor-like serine/threonine-protein kinase At3g47570 [Camelina sativa]|uniref:Probable LRR receptor-like serine/threonine-protein kinase At3g47570 n=1 Tax=Camelina sativa TaxID=90675 RepID=A0ABM0ZFL6_CAMSA|nr:PREDICTED: probable LRR receptor-like serine/threonine-protein kinase At3g47570 [Camelina sativa]